MALNFGFLALPYWRVKNGYPESLHTSIHNAVTGHWGNADPSTSTWSYLTLILSAQKKSNSLHLLIPTEFRFQCVIPNHNGNLKTCDPLLEFVISTASFYCLRAVVFYRRISAYKTTNPLSCLNEKTSARNENSVTHDGTRRTKC